MRNLILFGYNLRCPEPEGPKRQWQLCFLRLSGPKSKPERRKRESNFVVYIPLAPDSILIRLFISVSKNLVGYIFPLLLSMLLLINRIGH